MDNFLTTPEQRAAYAAVMRLANAVKPTAFEYDQHTFIDCRMYHGQCAHTHYRPNPKRIFASHASIIKD